MSFVGLLYCRLFGLSWNECTRENSVGTYEKCSAGISFIVLSFRFICMSQQNSTTLSFLFAEREQGGLHESRVMKSIFFRNASHLVAEKARVCCFYPYKEAYMSLSFKQTVDSDIPIPPQMVDQIINAMSHFKEMVLEVPNWWRYLSVSFVVLKILTIRHRAYSLPISWSPTIAHSLGSSNVTLVFCSRVMNLKYISPTWPCYVSL